MPGASAPSPLGGQDVVRAAPSALAPASATRPVAESSTGAVAELRAGAPASPAGVQAWSSTVQREAELMAAGPSGMAGPAGSSTSAAAAPAVIGEAPVQGSPAASAARTVRAAFGPEAEVTPGALALRLLGATAAASLLALGVARGLARLRQDDY